MDPTRHSTHELSPADIMRWVKDICKSSQVTFAWGFEPYSRDRPAPTVIFLSRHTTVQPDIMLLLIYLCLIFSIAAISLVPDYFTLSYAETQFPRHGELSHQDSC
jgi:hypothetical protein